MNSTYLEVRSKTWIRDSHGLFDYDTPQTMKEILKLTSSGTILRKGNEISFNPESISPMPGVLLKVFESSDQFLIFPVKHEPAGLIIKKIKPKSKYGYKLSKGDTIKIGRVKLKIKQINHSPTEESNVGLYDGSMTGENFCRICFRTHSNSVDPLFSICKCAGSMELVHLFCLRKYLLSKAIKKNFSNCISYLWKNLQCDVCKDVFPLTVKINEKVYETIVVDFESTSNYIMIEDLRKHKYKHIIHILTPTDAPLLIGRATDVDLKIGDISVSRSHSTIEAHKNEFFIKDNGSKFGTIVVQKKPIVVSKADSPRIQVGRSIFKFTYKTSIKPLKCFSFCCKKNAKVDSFPKSRTEIIWEEESFNSSEQYDEEERRIN